MLELLRDISHIYLFICQVVVLEHQDHSGSSLRVTFVELVLEGSFDPRFATSEIFLGCIILSSSFSTAMTHLQVEVRIVQKQDEFNLFIGQFKNLQAAMSANLLL